MMGSITQDLTSLGSGFKEIVPGLGFEEMNWMPSWPQRISDFCPAL